MSRPQIPLIGLLFQPWFAQNVQKYFYLKRVLKRSARGAKSYIIVYTNRHEKPLRHNPAWMTPQKAVAHVGSRKAETKRSLSVRPFLSSLSAPPYVDCIHENALRLKLILTCLSC